MVTSMADRRKITAVVFDLGGVLLDWDPRYLYRQLFADPAEMEDFLARICTADWHHAHDLGEDITQSCRRLARLHPRYRDMIMAWTERGEDMIAGQIDGTVGVLAELKAGGVRCLALSNMEPATFATRRARFTFMSWLDGMSSGIEGARPDRRSSRSCRRSGWTRPRRCSSTTRRATSRPPAAWACTPCITPPLARSGSSCARSASPPWTRPEMASAGPVQPVRSREGRARVDPPAGKPCPHRVAP
jgi:hypothetical protein